MTVRTFLAPSPIHGIGIFTAEPIAKGAVIWRFAGGLDAVLDAALLLGAPEPIRSYLRRYSYPHHEAADRIVLDVDNGRFMNHSATPNTDFRQVGVGFALHDIAEGEELTCDYSEFSPGFELD